MRTQLKSSKFTSLQLELLKLFSYEVTEQELLDIKAVLAHYFAQKVDTEMDELWETQHLSNATMDEWLDDHHRTPY